MIPIALARQLKEAGLVWQTTVNDFFAIPDRELDDKVFVISDIMVTMSLLKGWPALTFHGTAEWASDYLLTHEAVWIPTEAQLREALVATLKHPDTGDFSLSLDKTDYICTIEGQGEHLSFMAQTAAEAYAFALLHTLKQVK